MPDCRGIDGILPVRHRAQRDSIQGESCEIRRRIDEVTRTKATDEEHVSSEDTEMDKMHWQRTVAT